DRITPLPKVRGAIGGLLRNHPGPAPQHVSVLARRIPDAAARKFHPHDCESSYRVRGNGRAVGFAPRRPGYPGPSTNSPGRPAACTGPPITRFSHQNPEQIEEAGPLLPARSFFLTLHFLLHFLLDRPKGLGYTQELGLRSVLPEAPNARRGPLWNDGPGRQNVRMAV